MAAKKKATEKNLPYGVKASDLVRPKWEDGKNLEYSELRDMGLETPTISLYKTEKVGWAVCVLFISNPSRSARAKGIDTARFYAIGVNDKKMYTLGRGPHVTEEITVHLTKDNIERLMPLVELFKQGSVDANTIRDRISSRRAQGAMHRANGRTSWMW